MEDEHDGFCVLNPVVITCPKHGKFVETPLNHLLGYGCPICDAEDPQGLHGRLHAAYDKLVD